MIKTGTGKSRHSDPFKAGQNAAQEAIKRMGETADLLIVFASVSFEQSEMLKGINSVSSGSLVVGGSPGWGNITNEGPGDEEVAVIALKFEKTKIAATSVREVSKDSYKKGLEMGEKLIEAGGSPPKLMIMFHSPTEQGVDVDGFAQALKKKLGKVSTIIGGGVGDSMQIKPPFGYEYYNDELLKDSAVGVGFWGDFFFSVEADHGWGTIGLPAKVTKAKGNTVFEIDGKPAANIYEKYLKKQIDELAPESIAHLGYGYPLGIIPEKSGEKVIVRQVLWITKEGALTLSGSIPTGATVSLMYAEAKKMPEIAEQITERALEQLKGKNPELALIWDCVLRKTLLMPDHKKEIDAVIKVIGEKVPLFGFYTYGEWGMKKEDKEWFNLNEVMVVALLKE